MPKKNKQRIYKSKPDLDLTQIFDDEEDQVRINKRDHHFLPIEEAGSNENNPEELYLAREANNFIDEVDDEEHSELATEEFEIKSPTATVDHITEEEPEEFPALTLVNNQFNDEALPMSIGIGKNRALTAHY